MIDPIAGTREERELATPEALPQALQYGYGAGRLHYAFFAVIQFRSITGQTSH